MKRIAGLTSALAFGCAGAASAQDFTDRCAALTGHSLSGGVVTAAAMAELPGGGSPHCRVHGIMAPRVGLGTPDPEGPMKTYGAGFELRLPEDWNGRFLFQGGGGLDGAMRPALGSDGTRHGPLPLAEGYAVVTTDTGHNGTDATDGSFGVDPQARIDNGYNAVDQVATGARELIAAAYGSGPEYSYFNGCSNGGRQAMISAFRYPEQFDGIVAAAPAFDLVGAVVAWNWNTRALQAAAPLDGNGNPVISRAFSDADLALLQSAAIEACDGADGIEDGLIQDVSCQFDPAVLLCEPGASNECLSQAQVDAATAIYTGPSLADGTQIYGGLMPGAEAGGGGWRGWLLGTSPEAGSFGRQGTFQHDWLRYLAYEDPRPGMVPINDFDLDRDWEALQASAEIWGARSTDYDAFRERGGRMIVWHGTGDPVFSGHQLTEWYDELGEVYGDERMDFARLFFVPGVHHCAGGPGLSSFDALQAVVDWVETDTAPDQILTARAPSAEGAPLSRPACPYPAQARYSGDGDDTLAENFVCEMP